MSDFTSSFWSYYITIISVAGVVACLLLLIFAGFKKVKKQDDNSTGHVWDGDLRELNNPLPMWWVGLFLITIATASWYLWYYPGLGTYKGSSKWTQVQEWEQERDKALAAAAPAYATFHDKSVENLAQDPAAMEIAERTALLRAVSPSCRLWPQRLVQWMMCAISHTMYSAYQIHRTTRYALVWVNLSLVFARLATAWMAKAIRLWAHLT